ncbi:MAG: peptidoglycan D,D-transpeptidase FtsI family protein [Dongiaceae bacterium]
MHKRPRDYSVGNVVRNRRVEAYLVMARDRLLLGLALFMLAFTVIAGRLVDVALLRDAREIAASATEKQAPLFARADIVDRNGTILATTLSTASVYAEPRRILDAEQAARQLASVLPDTTYQDLLRRLTEDKAFVWLRRNLTPLQQAAVNRLGIPGISFQREDRRIYPDGPAVSHVVGYTNLDNSGIAGIEKQFDQQLRRSSQELALSLDLRFQHILREELIAGLRQFKAKAAGGLIVDAKSGEILAMISLPDFDPHQISRVSDQARFNRMTLGTYEMGSTFKIFNTALALDSGVVRLSDSFDATQPLKIANYTIHDFNPKNRWLSVSEIFKYSSNIGSAKIAMAVGGKKQKIFLEELGLLKKAQLEIPEIGAPQIPPRWNDVYTATVSYGHGISVTPIQLVRAIASQVNGGFLPQLTLLKRDPGEAVEGVQVIQAATSARIRQLMGLVVEEGSGKGAQVEGYAIGGKTGTAEKTAAGGYNQHAVLSSFVGIFPLNDPKFVIFAMLDEPQGTADTHGFATGGLVSAPLVGRVITRIGALSGIAPQENMGTLPEARYARMDGEKTNVAAQIASPAE